MRDGIAAVAALLAGVALVACGTLDAGELEEGISEEAESQFGAPVESVSCPDDIESETDVTFECEIVLSDGKTATAEGKVSDGDEGNVVYRIVPDTGGK
jgi:hypothetical protein